MENWRNNSLCWANSMAFTKINIEKDEYGVKLKFPNRTCKQCIRYPCFANIDKCASNFAAYGCIYYESKNNK